MHIGGQAFNVISLHDVISGPIFLKVLKISSPDFKLCLPFSVASPRRGRGAPLSPIPPLVPYLPHSLDGST
jgi:hypothetical protein